MKQIKTCTEAVNLLAELFPLYLGTLKWNNTIEISGEDTGEDSDLCVTIDGWLIITPYITTEECPSIPEPIEFKTIHYEISKVKVNPGSYLEPDSTDIVSIQRDIRSVTLAIHNVIHQLVENKMNYIGEMLSEKDMTEAKDEAKYIEEMIRNNSGNET